MHTTSSHTITTERAAHELIALGYHLVPIEPGSKRPLISWADAPSRHEDIERWFHRFGGQINIAIHAARSGIVVLDADTAEATAWIVMHCPHTPLWASTPRGGQHAYFRAGPDVPPLQTNLLGLGLDVKSGRSLIVASPSYCLAHRRHWEWEGPVLPPMDLPILPSNLIRPEPLLRVFPPDRGQGARPPPNGRIRNVLRWIMAIESVQGSGGSGPCFKVACRLVDAGLSWPEAWGWLCHWNQSGRAIPPWSEAELRHKLRDAFARPGHPRSRDGWKS